MNDPSNLIVRLKSAWCGCNRAAGSASAVGPLYSASAVIIALVSTRGETVPNVLPSLGGLAAGLYASRRLTMKFRPLHDRVVVRRIDAEEKTKGGIIIPDTAKEKPQEGEVIAVGAGARDESGKVVPLDLRAGDRVLFGKRSVCPRSRP